MTADQKAQRQIPEAVFGIKADIETSNIQGLQDIHPVSEKFSKFGPCNFERQGVASTNASEAAFSGSLSDVSYELNDLKGDVFGNVGIATYYPTVSFVKAGRQTLILLQTDAGWKLVHEH